MPYIEPKERPRIDKGLDALEAACPIRTMKAGELNYLLTVIIRDWATCGGQHLRYAELAEAIGALECVKLELYRRVLAPYEDEKCNTNGDVT